MLFCVFGLVKVMSVKRRKWSDGMVVMLQSLSTYELVTFESRCGGQSMWSGEVWYPRVMSILVMYGLSGVVKRAGMMECRLNCLFRLWRKLRSVGILFCCVCEAFMSPRTKMSRWGYVAISFLVCLLKAAVRRGGCDLSL